MEPAFWAEAPPVNIGVVLLAGADGTPVPTGMPPVVGGQLAPPGQTTGTTVVAGTDGQLAPPGQTTAAVVAGAEEAGGATDVGLVQSTPSQTTVEVYTVEVGLPTGQSVTVGAQEVIVYTAVE